jgi:hypothetical protein
MDGYSERMPSLFIISTTVTSPQIRDKSVPQIYNYGHPDSS